MQILTSFSSILQSTIYDADYSEGFINIAEDFEVIIITSISKLPQGYIPNEIQGIDSRLFNLLKVAIWMCGKDRFNPYFLLLISSRIC